MLQNFYYVENSNDNASVMDDSLTHRPKAWSSKYGLRIGLPSNRSDETKFECKGTVGDYSRTIIKIYFWYFF